MFLSGRSSLLLPASSEPRPYRKERKPPPDISPRASCISFSFVHFLISIPANRRSTTPPAASSSTAGTTTPSCTSTTWTSPWTPASTSATPPTRTAAARRSPCSGCAATWPPSGPCWGSWLRSSSSSSSSWSTRSARRRRICKTVSRRGGFSLSIIFQYLREKPTASLREESCRRRRCLLLEVSSEVVPGRRPADSHPARRRCSAAQ